jgi:hypothetical protein
MAIYELDNDTIRKITPTSFTSEGVWERKHLQSAFKKDIEAVAPDCLVIAEEFSEWADSKRRIDLLALDSSANLVVVELKRNESGEHMELQAIRYASMVSTLTYKNAVKTYQKYINDNNLDLEAEQSMLEFLNWDEPQEDEFNNEVRIILVSSDFAKELTTSVLWLKQYSIDISCVRAIPYKNGDQLLLDIQQIIPLPEAEEYQIKHKQKEEEQRQHRISDKDYTKYEFNGEEYNKRKLVLAVIKYWIEKNNPLDLDALVSSFPQELHAGGLFVSVEIAKDIYTRQGIQRHFLKDDELIHFENGTWFALSNQWGKGGIDKFIAHAKGLGLEIIES